MLHLVLCNGHQCKSWEQFNAWGTPEMADMCPLRWLLPLRIIQLTACAAANGEGRGLDDDAVVVTSEDEEDHSHEDDAVLVDALEVLRLSQPAPGDALTALCCMLPPDQQV